MPVEHNGSSSVTHACVQRHAAVRLPFSAGGRCCRIPAFLSISIGCGKCASTPARWSAASQSHGRATHGEKRMAGGVAAAGDHLHGSDDAFRRRHRRARAAAVRQGAAPDPAGDWSRSWGSRSCDIKVAAVCVYHTFVETALRALEGSGMHVAAVSTGFPAGLSPLAERVAEIRRSVEAGAHEIDVVITRAHVFGGRWQALYDEIAAFKQACGSAHMKVILGTGDLLTLRNVARASVVAMMAGADFIKTSTGKEPTNATLPVGSGDDARHSRIRAANWNGGGIQAGGRNSHGEAVARLAGDDEGRAWASRGCGRRCFASAPAACWAILSGNWSIMRPGDIRRSIGIRWRS